MRTGLVVALVVAMALAGCGGGESPGPTASGSTSTSPAPPESATNATLAADRVNGTAPLVVNFTLGASAGALSWHLSYGDGGLDNGTGQPPPSANHTYAIAGNFSAVLNVTYASGDASANASIQVALALGGASPPSHFDLGGSLGCAGDAHALEPMAPLNCVSFQGGPEATGIDGHWLALDERYWGLAMTTAMTVAGGLLSDSDCYFLAPDSTTELASASNDADPCGGVVPDGAGWLFLFPYAQPATTMSVDFTA